MTNDIPKCAVCGYHECHDPEAFLLVMTCGTHDRLECDDCYAKLHLDANGKG